jgi:hypothetical protein
VKKIFRWLLSNLLLILVIVSVIYSYMFWGNLTGKETPAGNAVAYLSNKFDGVGEFVEGVKNKQARLAGEPSALAQTLDNKQLDQPFGQPLSQQQAQVPSEPLSGESLEEQAVAATDSAASNAEIMTAASSQEGEAENDQSLNQPSANSNQQESTDNVGVNDSSENIASDSVDKMDKDDVEADAQTVKLKSEEDASVNSALVVAEQTATQAAESQTKLHQGELKQVVSQQAVEQQPVSISYSHNNMQVQQNSDGEVEVHPQAQSLTASVAENTAKENRSDEDVSGEKSSPQVKAEMSIPEVWVTARTSFYQKNYSLSEQSYQSLIAATKDNFDAYGELGNVYYNQGKKAEAAEAYLHAATILLFKGDIQRAQSLLPILQQLDASKASQLQQLMDSFPS